MTAEHAWRACVATRVGTWGLVAAAALASACGDDAQTCDAACEAEGSGASASSSSTATSSSSPTGPGAGGDSASSTDTGAGAGAPTGGTGGGTPSDTIIPADRLPPPGTWETAGVEGGIPARSTICADVTAAPFDADPTGVASAVGAIQAAIDQCPDGQVVLVPAGEYLIDGSIGIRSAITLRGEGSATEFRVETGDGTAIHMGGLGPWPPPKANDGYRAPITAGADRASATVTVADTSAIEVGKMVMIDEEDDPDLVWTKGDAPGRYRASMHMVESKTDTTVTFRPPLLTGFTRSPQISWFPDLLHDAGIEGIRFVGTGDGPGLFIDMFSAYNCWISDCEFTDMPQRTLMIAWSSHIELRRIFMHDQSNGGPNSEGIDLLADVSFSLIVDNVCVAGGFPQINIGDAGANPYYSGGMGNVIAYNYAVDAYYTDPPDSPDAGKMPADISTNHSPHAQFNLVEGNVVGKFGSDAYHGSGSHTVLLRNVATAASRWVGVSNANAVSIDRRNLYYSMVGNVLGTPGSSPIEYADQSGWSGTAIYRLGFPDVGNDGFDGTFPPNDLLHADGGPRDLYVDRDTTDVGTTLIEGNWNAATQQQDWSIPEQPIADSYFLGDKPAWFGSLAWPPVDPASPVTDDPTIIPAGYRYVNGADP